jgi:hypothetical protein
LVRNRTTAGYQVIEGEPKTKAGVRAVALDRHTVKVLRGHRERQLAHQAKRLAAGKSWHESGYVFIRPDGEPIHPGYERTDPRPGPHEPPTVHTEHDERLYCQLRALARRDSNSHS